MDSIDQLNNKFLEAAKKQELQQYCEKQYKEIVRLLSVNKKLEEEVAHLKNLLTNADSLIINPAPMTNEEAVCIKQIEQLKKISDSGIVLTLEESKKLDTYVKALRIIRSKNGDMKDVLRDVNTEDLLKIVEDNVK